MSVPYTSTLESAADQALRKLLENQRFMRGEARFPEVSPALISNVTEAVIEEVKQWQNRPLEELYPIVYLDALMVKVRDEGHVQNKAIYVATYAEELDQLISQIHRVHKAITG